MKPLFLDKSTLYPEVDYQALMAQMAHHTHPRRKLSELQNKGQLIRLKKGFYILSEEIIEHQASLEIAANLLYGPSYLSLEYALSFYGLIPERVETYTSVTSSKNKHFSTPVGHFTYQHLSNSLFPLGVTLQKTQDNRTYLIASPEKALMDMFTLKFHNSSAPKSTDVITAINDDLRIDTSTLSKMVNKPSLEFMKPFYKNRPWNKLAIEYILENL